MAIELHVFLERSKVPSLEEWQAVMEKMGFPAVLQTPFDVARDEGFRPATYDGHSTGFEFYLEPAMGVLLSYPQIALRVGKRDSCATFRWSGDVHEMSAALSAAAALTAITDGIYYYPDDAIVYGSREVIDATRRDLNLG